MEVIKVEHLFKQYRLGQVSTGTLSHDLNRWWHKIRGKEDPYELVTSVNDREQADGTLNPYVWALEDINFSVNQGEVLGIIGRNGAGKSTLLKVLSKVTSPTKGKIKINGRIASLLEVGTGFHPELTGRENIFLNGAILGMTKAEIRTKFDEIVAFSGVEKYIDTPVKRYSSVMYVRLAFAVAAHLEPEILIVDEVLAVGDAEFQKKCLGKMKDVAGNGRTVLFVSHNMVAVQSLCTRSILMHQGKINFVGSTEETVQRYFKLNANANKPTIAFTKDEQGIGGQGVQIKKISVLPESPSITEQTDIHFSFWNMSEHPSIYLAFDIVNMNEEVVFGSGHLIQSSDGICEAMCSIPANLMNDGTYTMTIYVQSPSFVLLFSAREIIQFEVVDKDRDYAYFGKVNGAVRPKLSWR